MWSPLFPLIYFFVKSLIVELGCAKIRTGAHEAQKTTKRREAKTYQQCVTMWRNIPFSVANVDDMHNNEKI